MASNLHIATAARNAMLDQINGQIGTSATGFLKIYSGTQPANAQTATSTANTLLAQLTLSATAFGAASNGTITINTITDDSSADATGTAVWATLTKNDGTRIIDLSVGTSGSDINFNSVNFQSGAVVSVSGLSLNIAA